MNETITRQLSTSPSVPTTLGFIKQAALPSSSSGPPATYSAEESFSAKANVRPEVEPPLPGGSDAVSSGRKSDLQNVKILCKPVLWHNTSPFNEDSGFIHKRLCDGPTFTAGTACAYSCEYCYVESQVFKLAAVRESLTESGKQFNQVVIRRKEAVQRLAQELTRRRLKNEQGQEAQGFLTPDLVEKWGLKDEWSLDGRVPKYCNPEWEGKVIFASPLVDVAPTQELAQETVEMCDAILRLTRFHIRLLSKSPLLERIVATQLAERFPDPATGAKIRMIFGFSTGTLDDRVARAIERHVPSPSARLRALHRLQDNGFRTFGMLCPILPKNDEAAYSTFAREAMGAIRAEKCEEIWAEPVNFRAGGTELTQGEDDQRQRDSFQATLAALVNEGFNEEAIRFEAVSKDSAEWERYCRDLFTALLEVAPEQRERRLIAGKKVSATVPKKLWWLHYPRSFESIRNYWEQRETEGALLLGPVMTNYRKSKANSTESLQSPKDIHVGSLDRVANGSGAVIHVSADGLPPIRSAVDLLTDKSLKFPAEIVAGVLHRGTKGVLAGPAKSGKSWALMHLALSVATGTPWLNWPTRKGKVLYVNYEIMEAAFADRVRKVVAVKNEDLGEELDYSELSIETMRGSLVPFDQYIEKLSRRLDGQEYSLIIIDPLYKGLIGKDENKASSINPLVGLLDGLAKQTGAAVMLAHHFPKGNQSKKAVVDRLVGSGVIARDADTIITLNTHRQENCLTIEFGLRNFPDQPALAFERQLPRFVLRDDLDPTALGGQDEMPKPDKAKLLVELLGDEGLAAAKWEKIALDQHGIPHATFYRQVKKLVKAGKIRLKEESNCWRPVD